ncbi:hypothetical protein TNCV_4987951 [Trichonephila clavipes]|nr:hypothetical protein TNCV_4987951 [Trichonephila clavipes]
MFDRLSSRQCGEGFFNSWEKGKVEISEGRIRVGLPNLNSGVRLLWIPIRGDCNALVYVKSLLMVLKIGCGLESDSGHLYRCLIPFRSLSPVFSICQEPHIPVVVMTIIKQQLNATLEHPRTERRPQSHVPTTDIRMRREHTLREYLITPSKYLDRWQRI